MKALILAAGFGIRLLPYTSVTPKPMFSLNKRPILDITVEKLLKAGFEEIYINTHHLHEKIKAFIQSRDFPGRIRVVHEPDILGTGGAIKNVEDFMKEDPFLVINSDIFSDIDLSDVWHFHLKGSWPVTLVMHDFKRFNTVEVNEDFYVTNFHEKKFIPVRNNKALAFTGIQVVSPQIYKAMPDTDRFSSIDIYKVLLRQKNAVKAYVCKKTYWCDIGTPDSYSKASALLTAAQCCKSEDTLNIRMKKIAGDGSDRSWRRAVFKDKSFVIVDHGIQAENREKNEVNAFVAIGSHLFSQRIPVPEIKNHDMFSGIVVMEDLGDTHLSHIINKEFSDEKRLNWYKRVCDLAIEFSLNGIKGFDLEWTYQTPRYSKQMILEKECQYFMDAFVNQYSGLDYKFEDLKPEFEFIADQALEHAFTGLMHRDLQSRNIMVKNNQLFFIDFQAARKGPLQYDLASLFIDPYVALSAPLQQELLQYSAETISRLTGFDSHMFIKGFRYCALTRNMQILGAFSHLSQNCGKPFFKQFIPLAVKTLEKGIQFLNIQKLKHLNELIREISCSPSFYNSHIPMQPIKTTHNEITL
ncbi:MAG: sugar phosphate nucleotidyltransferase [Thermodesulfobacteriota bacterium]|nr:sugar phosphate nucleotidyltransferase [Thermodesulfobacteriota bacterium]